MRESERGVWSRMRGLRNVRRAAAWPVRAVCACAVIAAVLLLHAPLAAQRGGVVRGRVVEAVRRSRPPSCAWRMRPAAPC